MAAQNGPRKNPLTRKWQPLLPTAQDRSATHHRMGKGDAGDTLSRKNKSDYLLPVIRNPGINERCTHRNTGYNINHSLKRISQTVGVTIPLTLCVGLVTAGLPPQKTSHTSIRNLGRHGTRQRSNHPNLLASLDTSVVDKANSLILKSFK